MIGYIYNFRRDATNPTFRKIRLNDVLQKGSKRKALKVETGPYFIDMTDEMK